MKKKKKNPSSFYHPMKINHNEHFPVSYLSKMASEYKQKGLEGEI